MNENARVLVVSNDQDLFANISANSPHSASVTQLALSDHAAEARSAVDLIQSSAGQEPLAVLILDLASIPRDLQHATIKQLKGLWPNGSLIVLGDAEDITHALDTHIQPLIYRAFKQPISVKQLALSLEPALGFFYKAEEGLRAAPAADLPPPIKADAKKSVVLLGFGLAALLGAAWYLLSSQSAPEPVASEITATQPSTINSDLNTRSALDDENTAHSQNVDTKNDIDLTIDLGELALTEGRLIAPKEDSAEHYFNLALSQDPYNNRAYSANQKLAQALLQAYPALIEEGRYKQAFAHLDAYKRIAPLDPKLSKLYQNAGNEVSEHFKALRDSNDSDAIEQAQTEYASLANRLDDKATMASILKNEAQTKQAIQDSLKKGALVPPAQGNAYSLLSEAMSNSLISRAAHDELAKQLANALQGRATALSKLDSITSDTLPEVNAVLRYSKLMNLETQQFTALQTARANYTQRQQELAEAASQEAAKPSIAPAKLLSKTEARYPQRALSRGIEGWVEVNFNIDQNGRPTNVVVAASEPADTFDQAAVNAIEDWKFLPAMNMQTGQPVPTETKTTRMHFKLEDR